jgi:hypothetical protein
MRHTRMPVTSKVHARPIKQTPFLVDLGDSRRMEIPDVADEVLTADLHS